MRHDIFSFTSMLYFPILPGKHSYKKGNIQIFKALVSICCDWLSKTHTAFPPSKYTCHFLSTHAISLMSTRSYHLLFVLQREAKGLFNTWIGAVQIHSWRHSSPGRVCCLNARNKQHGKESRYADIGEVSCAKSPTEPEAPSS